jgi:hypothetical protein
MYRRYRERRRRRRNDQDRPRRHWNLTSAFRTPRTQIAFLLIVALIIFLILQSAGR